MEPPAKIKISEVVAPVHMPAEATGLVLDAPAGGAAEVKDKPRIGRKCSCTWNCDLGDLFVPFLECICSGCNEED